jgi:hypothetical protein
MQGTTVSSWRSRKTSQHCDTKSGVLLLLLLLFRVGLSRDCPASTNPTVLAPSRNLSRNWIRHHHRSTGRSWCERNRQRNIDAATLRMPMLPNRQRPSAPQRARLRRSSRRLSKQGSSLRCVSSWAIRRRSSLCGKLLACFSGSAWTSRARRRRVFGLSDRDVALARRAPCC